jgi:hypothetical protein
MVLQNYYKPRLGNRGGYRRDRVYAERYATKDGGGGRGEEKDRTQGSGKGR